MSFVGLWRLGARESLAAGRVLPAGEGPFQLGDSLWRDDRRGERRAAQGSGCLRIGLSVMQEKSKKA